MSKEITISYDDVSPFMQHVKQLHSVEDNNTFILVTLPSYGRVAVVQHDQNIATIHGDPNATINLKGTVKQWKSLMITLEQLGIICVSCYFREGASKVQERFLRKYLRMVSANNFAFIKTTGV